MPFNHIWSRGIVSNVYNVKDYKGSFFNSSALAGPSGYSISVGKNSEGEMVFARSDAAEEWFPTGNINAGYQWYSSKTDHWIFDTAPIEWADTIWDNMMSLYPYDT